MSSRVDSYSLKIGKIHFVILFAVLFPILPSYFYFGGTSVRNLLLLGCFFLMLLPETHYPVSYMGNKAVLGCLIMWISFTFISMIINGDYMYAIFQAILWLGMCLLIINAIDSKDKFLKIIDVIIYTSSVIAIFGIIEEITHFNVFSILNTTDHVLNYMSLRLGILRIISFTSHTITYGVYCTFILSIIFYRLSLPHTKKNKVLRIIYVLICINAFLTLSRSSLMCLALSQILLLWLCGFKMFLKKLFKILIPLALVIAVFCIFSEQVRNAVQLSYYTVMALLNDEYIGYLVEAGFGSNANAVGQRFDLYTWVWEAVKEHYLIGLGRTASFQHYFITVAGNMIIKESIEVEWLRTLFRYGIFSMIAEILFFAALLVDSFRKKKKTAAVWEGKLNFSTVCFVLFLCYILVQFAVMQNEDTYIFFMVVCLYIAYSTHGKFNNGGYLS